MNETLKLLSEHTSIRKFNDTPVTQAQKDAILTSALRGASAGNMMLYSLIKIESQARLDFLAEWCDHQPFIADASFALMVVFDFHKWDRYLKLNAMDELEGYDGPTVTDLALGMQDAMIAAQNAVVAAESMGIGTCYIGDIMENRERIMAEFNLPLYAMPVTLVVFGNFDHKPQLKDRFDSKYIIFDETYRDLEKDDLHEMFRGKFDSDGSLSAFVKRKRSAPFYLEMIRSIDAYFKIFMIK